MQKLIHGGDVTSAKEHFSGEILDFSANINPMGLPPSAKEALEQHIEDVTVYPDPLCRKLVARLAEKEAVPPEYILCGNGSADLIFRLVWAIRPKRALIAEPTFAEYRLALESAGCSVSSFQLTEENDFQLDERILEEIHPSTGILFLCNPNNPTGQVVGQELLCQILVRCLSCGTLLVIDECFLDFLKDNELYSMKSWLKKFPNLLILKAFTKIYAMAGLRLGYCLCGNQFLIERMEACGQPWSVSTPAQTAGIAALDDGDYLTATHTLIEEERGYLKEALGKLDMEVIGSNANYIFFRTKDLPTVPLNQLTEKEGILIRNCSNYAGLDNRYYRIAVRTHRENERLIRVLTRVLKRAKTAEPEKKRRIADGEKKTELRVPSPEAVAGQSQDSVPKKEDKGKSLFAEKKGPSQPEEKQRKLYRFVSRSNK